MSELEKIGTRAVCAEVHDEEEDYDGCLYPDCNCVEAPEYARAALRAIKEAGYAVMPMPASMEQRAEIFVQMFGGYGDDLAAAMIAAAQKDTADDSR